MGRSNQRRRADKKRRQADRSYGGARASASRRPADGELEAWRVESLVVRGAAAATAGEQVAVAGSAEGLARCAQTMPPTAVTVLVGRACSRLVADKWDDGWQPLELARAASRRRGQRHAELLAEAMSGSECWEDAGTSAMPEAWSAQLVALGSPPVGRPGRDWLGAWLAAGGPGEVTFVGAMVVVLEALGVLLGLPPIDAVLPLPRQWGQAGASEGLYREDDPMLVKVRALLAKAESTEFEAESDAFTAKAQELMARHAIDDAVARAGSSRREAPVTRRIAVDDPYVDAKSQLLVVVARPNGVRCV